MEKDVTNQVMRAAAEGNLHALKEMAAVAANKGGVWNRALTLAAMDGRMDVCRLLVEDVRVDVNQPVNDVVPLCYSGWRMEGATAVFISAMYGTADTTRYLLDHGADPTVSGSLGSALHGAAMTGQCENVELLLSRGFDVDLFDSMHGTALHIAASKGEAGVVKILLEHHADPNMLYSLHSKPLGLAIQEESMECIRLLIKAGADVNFVDYIGATYLMVAVNNGLPDLMKCLLDAGANPNTPDAVKYPLELEDKIAKLKLEAAEAFRRKEYLRATDLYNCAMRLEDRVKEYAILLANRSICFLRMGQGEEAVSDATKCTRFRPHWPKGYYRQGAAYMLLEDYEKACEAFEDGLKLDRTNVDIKNALREAQEALKNADCAGK